MRSPLPLDQTTTAGGDAAARVERVLLGTATLPQAPSAAGLLEAFVAAGGRRIDLANVYGDGEASRIVGDWLSRTSPAGRLELYVKGCHPPLCAPDRVHGEVERARALLSVESLDHFILHRDDPGIPIGAWAEALLVQLDRGAVTSVGVSNWPPARFRELRTELGPEAHRLAVLSNHVSLAEMISPLMPGCRSLERDEAQRLAAEGVQVLAWAPLAGGFFAGRTHASWNSPSNRDRRRRATALGAARDVSATTIALAYVLAGHGSTMAAVGTRDPRHLDELMAAASVELGPDEIDWLEGGDREPPALLQEADR